MSRGAAADPHQKMFSHDTWATPKEDLNPWENSEHASKNASKSMQAGGKASKKDAKSLNNFFSSVFDNNAKTPDWEDRSRGAYSTVSKIQKSKTKKSRRPSKRSSVDGGPKDPLDRFLAQKSAHSERVDSDDRSRGAYSTMSKIKKSSNRRSKPKRVNSSDRLENFLEKAQGNVKRVDSDERSRGAYSTMSKMRSNSNRSKTKSRSNSHSNEPMSDSRSRPKSKPPGSTPAAGKASHGGLGSFLNHSKPKQKVDADERSTYTSMTRIREARLAAGLEEKPIPATKEDLLALIHSMPATAVKRSNHSSNEPRKGPFKENSHEGRQRKDPVKRSRREKLPTKSSQRIDGSLRKQRTLAPATPSRGVKPDLSIYNIRKEEKDRSDGRRRSGESGHSSPRRPPVSPRRRSVEHHSGSPRRRSDETNQRPRSPRRQSDESERKSKRREDHHGLSPLPHANHEDRSESGQTTPKTRNTAKISREAAMNASPRQTRNHRSRDVNSTLSRSRSRSPSKVKTEILSPKKRYQAMLGAPRNKVDRFRKNLPRRPTEFDDSCSSLTMPRHPPRKKSLGRPIIEEDQPENEVPSVQYTEDDIFSFYTWTSSRQDDEKIQAERLALKDSIRDTPLHRYYQRIVKA